jgi:zinc protease
LQFETQTAVWASAFYNGTSVDPDTFGVVIMPAPGISLADAEAALDGVIAKFLKDGVNPDDFARIKAQVRASEIYARDDAQALAREYGEALAIGLTVQDVQDWPAALQAVTPEDVMAAAHNVLDRKQAVTGWLTQEEAAE